MIWKVFATCLRNTKALHEHWEVELLQGGLHLEIEPFPGLKLDFGVDSGPLTVDRVIVNLDQPDKYELWLDDVTDESGDIAAQLRKFNFKEVE